MFFKNLWIKLGIGNKYYASIMEFLVFSFLAMLILNTAKLWMPYLMLPIVVVVFSFYDFIGHWPSRELFFFIDIFTSILMYVVVLYFPIRIVYLNFKKVIVPFLALVIKDIYALGLLDDDVKYFYGEDEEEKED